MTPMLTSRNSYAWWPPTALKLLSLTFSQRGANPPAPMDISQTIISTLASPCVLTPMTSMGSGASVGTLALWTGSLILKLIGHV